MYNHNIQNSQSWSLQLACRQYILLIQADTCRLWSAPYRAGFAQQGAKEKQLLKENNAFNVSSFVLRATMSGQYWPEGDEVYHAELTVPILLVHGMHDKFVPVEEDQRMAEVKRR